VERIRVLVIEDAKVWQNILRRWFGEYKCHVDIAGNYSDALEHLEREAYDMVTLDMALSSDEEAETVAVSSGWQLLHQRLSRDFPSTAIYVISASFKEEYNRVFDLSPRYGVKGFMVKMKFDPATLKEWIDEVKVFKQSGGRPDATQQELEHIYDQLAGETRDVKARFARSKDNKKQQELVQMYEQLLHIIKRNILLLEMQQAQHGIDVPLEILNSLGQFEQRRLEIQHELDLLLAQS
jgi:CheY-like chemotaxis protein